MKPGQPGPERDGTARFGRGLSWLVLLLILVGAYNSIVRYLSRYIGVHLASNALLELQWYLFSAMFLLAGAYTMRKDAHVRVDLLYQRFTPRRKAWVDLIGNLLLLLPFCLMMLWLSLPKVWESWRILERSSDAGGLPRYPLKTLIPLAFLLLLIEGVRQSLARIRFLRGAPPS